MSTKATRNRFAIAPPAPESSRSGGDETLIRPAATRQYPAPSGEFSLSHQTEVASERQTLPDLEQAPVPVIDFDDLHEERNQDTIPAPTWLGDD
jgi:hypothetical protein